MNEEREEDNSNRLETEGKLMRKVLTVLADRSKQSRRIAQAEILSGNLKTKEIYDAAHYYFANWKESIHPGLISLACEAVGGDPRETVLTQVSISLLSAAADIHDDVVDGSKTKNGEKTLYGKFGKDITILLGDAFWLKAFTVLHKAERNWTTKKDQLIWKTIEDLYLELGDAQSLEVSLRGKAIVDPEGYMSILKMKAASFEAQARIGAILGNGKKREIEAMTRFGRDFGILAFLREDFIDMFELDELQNRLNYEILPLPILHAFSDVRAKKRILRYLADISETNVESIIDIVFGLEDVKKLLIYLRCLAEKAVEDVSALRNTDAKDKLIMLAKAQTEDL